MRCILLLIMLWPAHLSHALGFDDVEVSSGLSTTMYQSVFSFGNSMAVETSARGALSGLLGWEAGVRLGFGPARPEGFVRILAEPADGAWDPVTGLELGLTGRARFDDGEKLLRETRAAMEEDISPVYIAVHSEPLAFRFGRGWRMSVLGLSVGTHLGHTGRTVRLHVGILTLGRRF